MNRTVCLVSLILCIVLVFSLFLSCLSQNSFFHKLDKSEDGLNDSDYIDETPAVNNFSEINYIAFGDSITYGLYQSERMEFPYPSLVSSTLGFKSYKNYAVCGGTFCSNDIGWFCMTDKILSITDEADIVSVMLGVNDFNRNLPLGTINDQDNTTIYGSLNLIAKHFDTYYKDSFVFFMTPYKERKNVYGLNSQGYNLLDVSNAIKEVATLHCYPVLDMFNYGRFEIEMNSPESDGVHPSQKFVTDYTCPQIVEFIKKNYKQ